MGDTVIRFTVDGSLPTATSPVFNPATPITLRETTIIRAVGQSPTMGKGPVAAAVYVRAAEDVATFESNLPIVLLHTHRSGTLNAANGTPPVSGSVSVFEPGDGGRGQAGGSGYLHQAGGPAHPRQQLAQLFPEELRASSCGRRGSTRTTTGRWWACPPTRTGTSSPRAAPTAAWSATRSPSP